MDTVTFQLDGETHACHVRVSEKARRVSLRVTDGGLEIVRPARARTFAPGALLTRFSPWIRRQLSRRAERLGALRSFDGKVLLRGRPVSVAWRDDLFPGVVEEPDRLVVASPSARGAAEVLRRWMFDAARVDFDAALRRRSAEMDQPFGRLAVRDQKWLWGSCSPASGTVSLNARLLMAPPAALDYIVVHELAHFRWRGHGVRFWDLVERFRPDYRAQRRWLRTNAALLRFPDAIPALDNVPA